MIRKHTKAAKKIFLEALSKSQPPGKTSFPLSDIPEKGDFFPRDFRISFCGLSRSRGDVWGGFPRPLLVQCGAVYLGGWRVWWVGGGELYGWMVGMGGGGYK